MKDIENNGNAFTKTATAWIKTLFAGSIFADEIMTYNLTMKKGGILKSSNWDGNFNSVQER